MSCWQFCMFQYCRIVLGRHYWRSKHPLLPARRLDSCIVLSFHPLFDEFRGKYPEDRKVRAMPDISRSFDSKSDLVMSLAGESTPYHCHIFYLPQTFPLLKINASRESTSCIYFKLFKGAARSSAFLHYQRHESERDPHQTWVSVHGWDPLFMHSLQMLLAFHSRENKAIWWFRVRTTFAEWSHWRPSCYDPGILFYFVQTSLYPLQTRNEYLLVHLIRCSPFEKVQFTMDPTLSRRNPKGRTGVIFHGPFDISQRKSK
jgi:hypothetical protein